jgi:hypothetical protein
MDATQAQMLSSVHGKIDQILVIYPKIATDHSDEEYEEVVKLFDKQGTVFRFLLLQNEIELHCSPTIYRGGGKGHQARPLPDDVMRDIIDLRPVMDFPTLFQNWKKEIEGIAKRNALLFRRWAQDPFVVKTWGDTCILLQPVYSPLMCYHFLPTELALQSATNCLVQPTPLCLEGGNLLRGMREVIVGKDLVIQNIRLRKAMLAREESRKAGQQTRKASDALPEIQPFEVEELAKALGGLPVRTLGAEHSHPKHGEISRLSPQTYQPLFHIDLYLTLGGWHHKEKNKELAFVACSKMTRTLLSGVNAARRNMVPDEAWDAHFDAAATELGAADYHVERLPILFLENLVFSWNNCLVEVDGSHRRVVLASYQVPEADDKDEQLNAVLQVLEPEVQRIYQAQGFEVCWLKTKKGGFFRRIVREGGGLHCVTKVLRRHVSATT